MIIDTSVLIDYLRQTPEARLFLDTLERPAKPTTHVVVEAELLDGARNVAEQRKIEQFLAGFTIELFDVQDARRSVDLFKAKRLSHGVGWQDALIAATCLRLQVPIVTLNEKHFRPIDGLTVIRPY